jgi:hypothetical protein
MIVAANRFPACVSGRERSPFEKQTGNAGAPFTDSFLNAFVQNVRQ